METIDVSCECQSDCCPMCIVIPFETAMGIVTIFPKAYIIVDGCTTGPKENDVLIESRDGYSLYRES